MVVCSCLCGVVAHGGPYEAGELAGDGDDDLGPGLAPLEHAVEAAVEAEHGPVGDGDNAGGLSLASLSQAEGAGVVPVVPGRLDEQAAGVAVAGMNRWHLRRKVSR